MNRRNPLALIEVAVEPKDIDQFDRLLAAARELPSIVIQRVEPGAPRMLLAGPDEMTLDRAIGRLNAEHGLAFHVGAPQVAYLETVLRQALVDYTRKAGGDAPTFARVIFSVEPHSRGGGFVSAMSGDDLPERFVAAVADAVEVEAVVPLVNTFGYINQLNWISRKRASYTLVVARDEIVGGGDDDPFAPATAVRA